MEKNNKFKDYIGNKFVINSILIILIIFILFIFSLFINFRKTVIKSNSEKNKIIGEFISREYGEYRSDLLKISNSYTVKKFIVDENYRRNSHEILYRSINKHRIRGNFILLNQEKEILASNLYLDNQKNIVNNIDLVGALEKLREDGIYEGLIEEDFLYNQGGKLILGKRIDSYGSMGYLFFLLGDKDIEDYIRYKDLDTVAIVDSYNNLIYSNNDHIKNTMGKLSLDIENQNTIYFNNIMYYVSSRPIRNTSMTVHSMTSIEAYYQFIKLAIFFLIIITVFMITMIGIFAPEVTKRSLRSLDSLSIALDQLKKGNLDYRIEAKTFDEFQDIFNAFNMMSSQIEELIEDNNEIAERKRIMEIKNLESQFNPHFIFNIMEMLRYEILFDPLKASDMIVKFANLMRYNINYGTTEVKLDTDLEYIKDYLNLQKNRFSDRLNYIIDVDDELGECLIPKLIFQPIIENSIKYGMELKEKLDIYIGIKIIKDELLIHIEDNGPGLSREKLSYIREILREERRTSNHIGLYNVSRTISLLYGEAYGLEIFSEINKGTLVKLNLPIREMV